MYVSFIRSATVLYRKLKLLYCLAFGLLATKYPQYRVECALQSTPYHDCSVKYSCVVSITRPKEESTEEKRARKQAVKEERRVGSYDVHRVNVSMFDLFMYTAEACREESNKVSLQE